MRRRMKSVAWVGPLILIILFLVKGLVVPVTVMVTGLTLAAFAGLFFDEREDDVTKDIPGD